jgi:hypothetical protein
MKIRIADERTIGELKREFNAEFPFLQLEFFSGTTVNGIPKPLQRIVDKTKTLKSLRNIHDEGELIFSGEDKVSTIEKTAKEKFGLSIQIFRKSGYQWLLTTSTDDFTLNHQNALGKEMSASVAADEPEDIHEQE